MDADQIVGSFGEPLARDPASVNLDVLDRQIGFVARRALLALRREFALEVQAKPIVFNALVLVGANPGIAQSSLARSLNLDKGTATHLIQELEDAGWIERRSRLNDRRRKGVFLAPNGVQEVARLKAQVQPLFDRINGLYSVEELNQLLSLLNRLFEHLEPGIAE
jgi:DNA-binding MarR family transcriptional regulator